MDFAEIFEGRSVEEIKGIVDAGREILKGRKDELVEARKAEKAEAKAEAEAAGREAVEKLEKGEEIMVIFKGEVTEVSFVKMTEKRFTVEVDGVKRSVMFDKFVRVADEVEAEEIA